jgi:hypothetical protein
MNQYIITEEELEQLAKNVSVKAEKIAFAVLQRPYNTQAEREKVLGELFGKCKAEELRNKKACDDGVDNITSFQLRARQGAFERVCIWIEELREGKDGE